MTDTAIEARDLTPEEQQAAAEHAYELQEAVKTGLRAGRMALWSLAKALHEFDEVRGWAALGHESLGEWLADPDIGLTRRTYFRLTKTYRGLVIRRELPAGRLEKLDPSKVDIVLPKVEKGDVLLEDALADVEALPARDLREKYVGHRPQEEEPAPPDAEIVDGEATDIDTEPVSADAVGLRDAETVDDPPEGAEALRTAENGQVDADVLAQAQDDWDQLRESLVDAAGSGAANPRVPAKLIRVGVRGVDLLLGRATDGGSA